MGLNCKNCKRKCCEGYLHARGGEFVILLPLSRKEIKIEGIPLIRVTDRLWRCKWFDKKTGRCLNYYKRPALCKFWYCGQHEIQKTPEILAKKQSKININESNQNKSFVLAFTPKMREDRE